MDLCFCLIRLAMVILSMLGLLALLQQAPGSPLLAAVVLEVLTGAGIVLSGIPGNFAMLHRRSWGLPLAWLCALATLGSFLVGLWKLFLTLGIRAEPGSPEFIGFLIGGSLVGIIRLGLLGLYVAAVINFSAWHRGQASRAAKA